MSGIVCPHCRERIQIFSPSQATASALGEVSILATVPLDPTTGIGRDQGQPVILCQPDSPVTPAFRTLADRVAAHCDSPPAVSPDGNQA